MSLEQGYELLDVTPGRRLPSPDNPYEHRVRFTGPYLDVFGEPAAFELTFCFDGQLFRTTQTPADKREWTASALKHDETLLRIPCRNTVEGLQAMQRILDPRAISKTPGAYHREAQLKRQPEELQQLFGMRGKMQHPLRVWRPWNSNDGTPPANTVSGSRPDWVHLQHSQLACFHHQSQNEMRLVWRRSFQARFVSHQYCDGPMLANRKLLDNMTPEIGRAAVRHYADRWIETTVREFANHVWNAESKEASARARKERQDATK